MMTDPIADMLTRIRNANSIERPLVDMGATKLKVAIAKALKEEGFILDYKVGKFVHHPDGSNEFVEGAPLSEPKVTLRVYLKYGPEGERVIRHISRVSKPGKRVFKPVTGLKKVLDGLGIAVLSTNKGVLSDRQARQAGVGGEVICYVW
jgi:small subunit ribosomal protein S8